jgi:hypothetical protein
MAQEIEEQPVIGFQRPGHVDDEVGEVLLLLAQRQAVPVELLLALHAVGAVAHGPMMSSSYVGLVDRVAPVAGFPAGPAACR